MRYKYHYTYGQGETVQLIGEMKESTRSQHSRPSITGESVHTGLPGTLLLSTCVIETYLKLAPTEGGSIEDSNHKIRSEFLVGRPAILD